MTNERPRAVALRYDQDHESAPRVLAKGQGPVAERIIALAHEHGIPLHEDRDLVIRGTFSFLLAIAEMDRIRLKRLSSRFDRLAMIRE